MNDDLRGSRADTPATRWSSARFAIWTACAAWLLYLAVALVRCVVYGFRHPEILMERHALTALVAVGFSAAIYLFLRRFEAADTSRRLIIALATAVPPAVLLSVINYNVMFVFAPQGLLREMGLEMHLTLAGEVLHSSIENYFVFAAWGVLYTAVSHAVQTQDALRRAAASEAATRVAELRALRFQLDPHFLFNALNTVSGLIIANQPKAANQTVEALAAFLRATLAADATADVTLAEELGLQNLYLEIEQIRFGDRLSVATRVPDTLNGALVPALILQPIIENSIRHAVARTVKPVRITITARAEQVRLLVTIEDDGPGGGSGTGLGVGLSNVVNRLRLRYDGQAGCIHRRLPCGVSCTEIHMPLSYG